MKATKTEKSKTAKTAAPTANTVSASRVPKPGIKTAAKAEKSRSEIAPAATAAQKKVSSPKPRATVAASKPSLKAPATSAPTTTQTQPAAPIAEKASAPAIAAPRRELTTDLIATRAYILWEQQGKPQGRELANWLLAESQLKQEIQSFTE